MPSGNFADGTGDDRVTAVALVQHQNRGVLATKVAMRLAVLPTGRLARVLDCFAGDHDVWDTAQEVASQPIEVLHNDADPGYRTHLAMAAADALRLLDLDRFDLVDLDAWRPPYHELSVICERQYSGVVAYTSIVNQPHMAPVEEVGIPREWRKLAPAPLGGVESSAAEQWMAFLHTCGWERTHIVQTLGRSGVHLYGVCGGYQHFDADRYSSFYQEALRSRRLAQLFGP